LGFRFFASGLALREALAKIAPALFADTPSFFSIFFCTDLKLIGLPFWISAGNRYPASGLYLDIWIPSGHVLRCISLFSGKRLDENSVLDGSVVQIFGFGVQIGQLLVQMVSRILFLDFLWTDFQNFCERVGWGLPGTFTVR
jgi:hypothetical protein